MKIISTDDKMIGINYVQALNSFVGFFSEKKLKVENELIEFVINLGGFNKLVTSKRFCVYLCSSIIQISDKKIDSIFKRFALLSSETEKIIKLEISYHFRFYIKESEEQNLKKSLKMFERYMTDIEGEIRNLSFESIFTSLDKINDEGFLLNLENLLDENFEDDSQFKNSEKNKLALLILNFNYSNNNVEKKEFIRPMKKFLKLNLEVKNHIFIQFVIENYELIIKYLVKFKLESYLDELVLMIRDSISENLKFKNGAQKCKTAEINNIDIREIFYLNLDQIIKNTPVILLNKYLIQKIFSLIVEPESFNKYINIFLKKLKVILENQDDNHEFIKEFHSKSKILEQKIILTEDWRKNFYFLSSLKSCVKVFTNDEFLEGLVTFIKSNLTQKLQFQIQLMSVKLLSKIFFLSNQKIKEGLIKYLDYSIIQNKSYYVRRLFYYFFEEIIEDISFKYIKESGIFDLLFKTLTESVRNGRVQLVRIMIKIYPLILDDQKSKIHIKTVLKNYSNSEKSDLELISIIQSFENLVGNYDSNKYDLINHQKIIENQNFLKENELNYMKILKNSSEKRRKSNSEISEFKKRGKVLGTECVKGDQAKNLNFNIDIPQSDKRKQNIIKTGSVLNKKNIIIDTQVKKGVKEGPPAIEPMGNGKNTTSHRKSEYNSEKLFKK